MKHRKSTAIKKQKVTDQFIATGGNTQLACKNANVSRSTFYEWCNNDPQFSMTIDKILRGIKKCGEDKLLARAIEGDPKAWQQKITGIQKKIERLDSKNQCT